MRRLGIVAVSLTFVLVAGLLIVLDLRRVVPQLQCRCPHIRALVVGKAFVGNPAWSPDGVWIAFDKARVSDGRLAVTSEIYLAKPGGGGIRRLTDDNAEDTHPTWSPDSRSLAYAIDLDFPSNQASYISRMDIGTGNTSIMFRCPRRCADPTWSPDGKRLAFQMWTKRRPPSDWEIWLLDIETSEAHRFTSLATRSEGLTWSPDSRRLLFTRDGTIVSCPIDGSAQEEVLPVGASVGYPAWYPARDVLAFAREESVAMPGGQEQVRRIYVSTSNGAAPYLLLDEAVEGWMYSPALSPDGTMLAFTYRLHWFWRELYVADLPQP